MDFRYEFKILALVVIAFAMIRNSSFLIEGLQASKEEIDQCKESVNELTQLIEDSKTRDQERYDQALQVWNTAKAQFDDDFKNDPDMWPICAENEDLCDPIDWFDKYEDSGISKGAIFGGGVGIGHKECIKRCRDIPRCDFANVDPNNTCILASLSTGVTPGVSSGIITSTGVRRRDNVYLSDAGMDVPGFTTEDDFDACAEKCKDTDGCGWFGYNNATKWCVLKHRGPQYIGWTQYYKKKVPTPTLSENHPYFENSPLGAKPKRSDDDYNLPISAPSVVCQICQQGMNDVTTEESKNVALQQAQQCIASLDETGGTSGGTNGGNTGGTNGGNSSPRGTDENERTSENGLNNNQLFIGIGLVFVLMCSMFMMMMFMMRRR
jgi:hypothetical protein